MGVPWPGLGGDARAMPVSSFPASQLSAGVFLGCLAARSRFSQRVVFNLAVLRRRGGCDKCRCVSSGSPCPAPQPFRVPVPSLRGAGVARTALGSVCRGHKQRLETIKKCSNKAHKSQKIYEDDKCQRSLR